MPQQTTRRKKTEYVRYQSKQRCLLYDSLVIDLVHLVGGLVGPVHSTTHQKHFTGIARLRLFAASWFAFNFQLLHRSRRSTYRLLVRLDQTLLR